MRRYAGVAAPCHQPAGHRVQRRRLLARSDQAQASAAASASARAHAAALARDLKITPANGSRRVDPSDGISVTAVKAR